ncbi:alpha-L-rhamnosidase C-terminal domain-containing protein [uncultured Bacteroides sp.]|uniref:alpha-L-rhamnosidase-related protein n=1 Tax=uncultured Bacteroides sp. TaxID=162156 RepID=UPI002AAB58DC|nr:alpha-L-rhamnosidase C-terminal domain-containing protein [uncultured Bacteroides sp.]
MKVFNQLLLTACSLAFLTSGIDTASASTSGKNVESSYNLATEYLTPKRVMWISDSTGKYIRKSNNLLLPFSGQVSVADTSYTTMISRDGSKAALLLDFGREIQGGIEIASSIRDSQTPVSLRIRFGESVTEAMSPITDKNGASNDHALRDFTLDAPWLGTVQVGNSGFRFVRIELEDSNVKYNLKAVRAISRYQDIPYLGSFESDNPRLNDIWRTGAYTVHLCMQKYLWDGIKRDRLVWVGDLHPEVMTILSAFGHNGAVNRSLDFARDDTPLPGWMNGMCSYSLWWIIIQRDLYMYRGDMAYLKSQHTYLKGLLSQVCGMIDRDGNEKLNGTRFLDWPTSENKDVINSGLHSMCYMAIKAGLELGKVLNDNGIVKMCSETAENLKKKDTGNYNNKEAAALKVISGLSRNKKDRDVILRSGARSFSTFYGYYMLEALAMNKKFDEATDIISKYWGAMLDLGATTFWEELNYDDIAKAGRIDEFMSDGKYNIHANGGNYCYKGLRMSLCHGWASGVTSWMTRYILGITPTEPGCRTIVVEPHLSGCNRVMGNFPTPMGIVRVSHKKNSEGKISSEITAPKGIRIILKNATMRHITYTE